MESEGFVQNAQVNGLANYARASPLLDADGSAEVRMLIVASNYRATSRPLSGCCTAKALHRCAKEAGVEDLVALYDDQCTSSSVLFSLRAMASRCGVDDVLVFYFAGHGAEGQDAFAECNNFVLVDKRGQVSSSTLLSSQAVIRELLETTPTSARLLFLTDTCFSTPLINLDTQIATGRQAVSITGIQAPDVAEDQGNIFSHILLLAMEKLSKADRDNYSVGMLFNAMLHENELVFGSRQELLFQCAPSFSSDAMAWPIVARPGYRSPLSLFSETNSIDPLFVAPSILPSIRREAINAPFSVEEYVQQIVGLDAIGFKPCRACAAGYSAASNCCLQ